jgi:hypothetical protein
MAKRRALALTAAHKTTFLEGIAAGVPVWTAARRAGHNHARFYAERPRDPEFAAAWRQAYERSFPTLNAEAARRGLEFDQRVGKLQPSREPKS